MGRFYKTAQPEFVTDGIYKPDWDLLGEALATKDKELENQANTIALLRDVPFNYRPEEEAYAKAARDKVAAGIDPIAKMFATDRLNPELGAKLAALKRDALKEFKTGTIAQMELSKKNWDEFEKARLALKDNAAKEIYEKVPALHDEQVRMTGVYKPFVAPTMYESRDPLSEYYKTDRFQKLKATHLGWGKKGLTQATIDADFLSYLNGDPELLAYAKNRDVYDLDPRVGKYLNDEGKFSLDAGYRLGKTAPPSTKAHSYLEMEYGAFSGGGGGGKKDVYVPEPAFRIVNPEKYRNMRTHVIEQGLKDYINPMMDATNKRLVAAGMVPLSKSNTQGNYEEIMKTIDARMEEIKNVPEANRTPKQKEEARLLLGTKNAMTEMYDKAVLNPTVSWSNFADALTKAGVPNATKITNAIKDNVHDGEEIMTHPIALDFGDKKINSEKFDKGKYILVAKPEMLKGSTVIDGASKKGIKGFTFVKGSSKPDGFSKSLPLNYLQSQLIVEYTDGTEEMINGYTPMQDVMPVDSFKGLLKEDMPAPFDSTKVNFYNLAQRDSIRSKVEWDKSPRPYEGGGGLLDYLTGGDKNKKNKEEGVLDKKIREQREAQQQE